MSKRQEANKIREYLKAKGIKLPRGTISLEDLQKEKERYDKVEDLGFKVDFPTLYKVEIENVKKFEQKADSFDPTDKTEFTFEKSVSDSEITLYVSKVFQQNLVADIYISFTFDCPKQLIIIC